MGNDEAILAITPEELGAMTPEQQGRFFDGLKEMRKSYSAEVREEAAKDEWEKIKQAYNELLTAETGLENICICVCEAKVVGIEHVEKVPGAHLNEWHPGLIVNYALSASHSIEFKGDLLEVVAGQQIQCEVYKQAISLWEKEEAKVAQRLKLSPKKQKFHTTRREKFLEEFKKDKVEIILLLGTKDAKVDKLKDGYLFKDVVIHTHIHIGDEYEYIGAGAFFPAGNHGVAFRELQQSTSEM